VTVTEILAKLDMGAHVAGDARTKQLIVSGTPEDIKQMEKLIRALDVEVPREPRGRPGDGGRRKATNAGSSR
jgi:type II secretory pathway component GspD/PulD (secretin)